MPNKIKPLELSVKENERYNADKELMCSLRTEFFAPRVELDGMNRAQYYESNRKQDLSYIPPKRNKTDMRIVTGTTREKDTTLLSTLLNLNMVPDITAFDSDDLIVSGLGDDMTDLIKKTREIEVWDKKRPIIYREMIAQGDVFVEETYVEDFMEMPLEKIDWDPEKEGSMELSFTKRLKKINSGCSARMIRGNLVFLGDMTIEYIEDQDVVAICTIMPRAKAYARYGKWERWKHVPTEINQIEMFESSAGVYSTTNWAMFNTTQQYVSEVKLYQKTNNLFGIYLNGIPMMPHNYPMTAMYRSGELPFAQGKLEPISGFALSKSQPSKTKVDQEILDEVTMLMVEAMRQKRKPPMGSSSDKVYSPSIFNAGTITPEVGQNTFHSLLPDSALRLENTEFSFYNTIKESINEKTTNDVYSGEGQRGVDTLGQAEIMKEQQMLKLGSSLDGVNHLERRLAWLRTENAIVNLTMPVDTSMEVLKTELGEQLKTKNKYRSMSVSTTVENGEKGTRLFRFTEEPFPTIGEQVKEEKALSDQYGQQVRISYLNPEQLRMMRYKWFVVIVPTPKSNDRLAQLMFVKNVNEAIAIFGPDALNQDYIKQRFAVLINEDYNKFFKSVDIMSMLQMGGATMGGAPTGAPAQPRGPRMPLTPAQ